MSCTKCIASKEKHTASEYFMASAVQEVGRGFSASKHKSTLGGGGGGKMEAVPYLCKSSK